MGGCDGLQKLCWLRRTDDGLVNGAGTEERLARVDGASEGGRRLFHLSPLKPLQLTRRSDSQQHLPPFSAGCIMESLNARALDRPHIKNQTAHNHTL